VPYLVLKYNMALLAVLVAVVFSKLNTLEIIVPFTPIGAELFADVNNVEGVPIGTGK